MSFHIEPFDQYTAPEAEISRLHDVWTLFDAEYLPDDPPKPLEQLVAELRKVRLNRYEPKWIAFEGDKAVGFSGAWIDFDRDDKNVFGLVFIRPDARGRGYARPLTERVLDAAADKGCDVVVTEVPSGHPESALIEGIGLKPVLKERISRLRISDLDPELMQKWIDRASERASDYEVKVYETPMPADVLPGFADLMDVMNTAPLEEMHEAPKKRTVESLVHEEEQLSGAGESLLACIAVHKPTGEYAGFTTIKFQANHAREAHQHDTGVNPAHRNKGLGRWIKAVNILEFVRRHPETEWVDTGNAGSNEPMLNINYEMGYHTECEIQVYQGPLDLVRRWVDRR